MNNNHEQFDTSIPERIGGRAVFGEEVRAGSSTQCPSSSRTRSNGQGAKKHVLTDCAARCARLCVLQEE
eukprot:scaffold1864_cov106-Isochrysis_galbana.AAC.17